MNKKLIYKLCNLLLVSAITISITGCNSSNNQMIKQSQSLSAMHCLNMCASKQQTCQTGCATEDCGCMQVYETCSNDCS